MERGVIIPFHVWMIIFPVCKIGFGFLTKSAKQAGAELCKGQCSKIASQYLMANSIQVKDS